MEKMLAGHLHDSSDQAPDIVNTLEKAQIALFHLAGQWPARHAAHASVDYEV